MHLAGKDEPEVPGRREQWATRITFFVLGFVMASWAPLIPLVQSDLQLDPAQLGGLLLCVGVGSVTTMPFAGGLASHLGCRRIILMATLLVCASLPIVVSAQTPILLEVGLFCFGAGLGTIDVVVNIQAVIVERAGGRPMMSGFHGLFSVGGLAGAGAMTGLLAAGCPPLAGILILVIMALALELGMSGGLLPYAGEGGKAVFALPRGRVALIGAFCFVLFLAEGSVLDWSGILLSSVHGLREDLAGLGYVAFSAAMTIGRLSGDALVHALGSRFIVLVGASLSAAGFALASWVPSWQAAIFGFAMVGAGASNVVPVLFSEAGRQRAMPTNLAIAAVTTMGYAGVLLGPALIGFVARATTLPLALLGVMLMLVCVALGASAATAAAGSSEFSGRAESRRG